MGEMAMPDLRKRIEESENPLQELMSSIPGFDGYRDRQIRRKADAMVREHLVGLLDGIRGDLDKAIERWSRTKGLPGLDDFDGVRGPLGKVRDTLRFADYGYTGWFDAVKIKEAELDALYQYDLGLKQQIADVGAAIQALGGADESTVAGLVEAAIGAVETLQEAVDQREQVAMRTVPE